MAQLSTTLSGVADEDFVAAELSRRGYIATMTLRNSRGIDILAADAKQSVRIQVKTNQGSKRDWMIDRKVEAGDESLFFVFVNLNDLGQAPSFHVVRGVDVIAECKRQTQGLIDRDMDNSIRHFKDPEGLHLGRWDTLGLDSTLECLNPDSTRTSLLLNSGVSNGVRCARQPTEGRAEES